MQRLDTPKILKRDTLNLSQNLNFSKLPTSLEKKNQTMASTLFKLTAMSQPNLHHTQIKNSLTYSGKLLKLVIQPRTVVGFNHRDSSTDHH